MTQIRRIAPILPLAFVLFVPAALGESHVPEIPGLTVEDPFPRGCVDCHIDRPEEKMDVRISTQIRTWSERVDTEVLERVRTITADTVELSGRHPLLPAQSYEDIPASCMECHDGTRQGIPRMGPMLHALHLVGGQENHFLTVFGGECTYCHKFDADTGNWSILSAPEN